MSSKYIKVVELGSGRLESNNPELFERSDKPLSIGNNFPAEAEFNGRIKNTVQAYSSHEDMENQQLTYWASLNPEERLRQLKMLIMASYSIKSEPQFTELSKSINFQRDRS